MRNLAIFAAHAAAGGLKRLHIAPILLGDGVRLFEHLGERAIGVRKIDSLDAGDVSHLRFAVLRQ